MRSPDARDCFFVARHPKRVKLQLNCDDTAQYRFTKTNASLLSYGVDIDVVKPVDMTVLKENLGETFLTLERQRSSQGSSTESYYLLALRYSQIADKNIAYPTPIFQTQFFKGWPSGDKGSYSNHPCLTVKFPTKWSCREVLKITFDVDYSVNGIPYHEHFERTIYDPSNQIIDFTSEVYFKR